ncbi:hypothetical protein P029_03510 [Anaplasma phagocytophilum str. Norway variant2]|uniref:Uncharacterized protein n=1 Tax=Anaplasma phagocytophilum str. Norway variant2 TaxID=1392507 RepID=A0A161I622_ANAPH|nr:hypothetical protein [Anaplasma phagocytophilum]ANC34413.1 hypothetical protein P029_03510 [Anaplasma phagocytophilum str. Norway variant2]
MRLRGAASVDVDTDEGIFDTSFYITPRNQAGERVRVGSSASSRAPRGALSLALGTSLTSLDSMVYETEGCCFS